MVKKQESQKSNAAADIKSEKPKVESQKDQKKVKREDEYEYDDEYYDEEEAGADGLTTEAALASGKDGKYNH